jgi:uncharacterized protein YbjT (DUF2867 family)
MVRRMRILVSGASGFVGAMLTPRLVAEGHEVRALARDPERAYRALASQLLREARGDGASADGLELLELEVVRGDVLTGAGLERALAGVEVAYYLIHSMERVRDGGGARGPREALADRERRAAEHFARAAAGAGVRRIVYLGGLVPRDWPPTRHLASRRGVEEVMLEASPETIALRASIVIAARSRSFRLLVRLVERLPLLTLPAWRSYRTQPIDGRDLVAMLARAADPLPFDERVIDVAGPEVLSYEEMLQRIAEMMLIRRRSLRLRFPATGFSARIAAAIANEDPELTVSLMEALRGDLLPSGSAERTAAAFGVQLHSFDAAVEHALREWEAVEPLAAR